MRKRNPLNHLPKVNFRRFSAKEKVDETIGQAPGTLVYTGKKQSEIALELISFNKANFKRIEITDIQQIDLESESFHWLNVAGLSDLNIIEQIGAHFKLHPLLLEDVLQVDQRPKMEDFGDYLFFTIKMFHAKAEEELEYEHLSFVLGKNWVISFQEVEEDQFDLLRERLQTSYGKIRQKKADYLFYRFIDIIIDHYFLIIDNMVEKIEHLEDEAIDHPGIHTLRKLQYSRKELIHFRKSIYPLRESINSIIKGDSKLLDKETERYFFDAYDHCVQVIESLDTSRELLNGVMDLYMNASGNRMNQIMKVLTIMSSIFIPLTFIAGIYGMNFQYMPELGKPWAYPITLLIMMVIAFAMIFIFKIKKWF